MPYLPIPSFSDNVIPVGLGYIVCISYCTSGDRKSVLDVGGSSKEGELEKRCKDSAGPGEDGDASVVALTTSLDWRAGDTSSGLQDVDASLPVSKCVVYLCASECVLKHVSNCLAFIVDSSLQGSFSELYSDFSTLFAAEKTFDAGSSGLLRLAEYLFALPIDFAVVCLS